MTAASSPPSIPARPIRNDEAAPVDTTDATGAEAEGIAVLGVCAAALSLAIDETGTGMIVIVL